MILKGIVALKHTLVIVKTNFKRNALVCVCSVRFCVCRCICFQYAFPCVSVLWVEAGGYLLLSFLSCHPPFCLFVCFILFSYCLLSLDRFLTVLELVKKTRQTGIYLLFSLYLPGHELQLFTTTHSYFKLWFWEFKKHVLITARQTLYWLKNFQSLQDLL